MSLITDWVLRCHSRESDGRQYTNLTTDYACGWDCTSVGGQHTSYSVLQVCYVHSAACTSVLRVLSDWTLRSAAYPSNKLAMPVRRQTKVHANGEGRLR